MSWEHRQDKPSVSWDGSSPSVPNSLPIRPRFPPHPCWKAVNSATGSSGLQLEAPRHHSHPRHTETGWDFQATFRELSSHLRPLKIILSGCSETPCCFKKLGSLKH